MLTILCWIIMLPLYLVSLLPLCVHHFFSSVLALLMRKVFKYRVDVVDSNLRNSFPELSDNEINKLTKEYYVYMCDVICETIWGLTRTTTYMRKIGMFRVENPELLNREFDKHKGVVVFLSHTGNWELLAGICSFSEVPPSFTVDQGVFAYHPMRNKLSEKLFKMIRLSHKKGEGGIVPSSQMLRFVIKHKGEDWLYFFNSDQCPPPTAKVQSIFLNQPTLWVNGGEIIAKKFGMPVVYMYTDRVGRGKYVVKYDLICEDASKVDGNFIINEYIRLLERDIVANKSNWLWSHKRWKHKPADLNKDI